ncbi:Hypp5881 [Branchiostoma lanceolatum]|uniref:Hypp5881 protein n=1 Tax=Branchiostoma lanceolatum TaxID=7740 RepID=A0A8J9YR89_BRALA|nr:Hypp5881 [Branchiostoma lanceolatum]
MAYTSGLVGYWPLNGRHGSHDVSGYGNDGVQFDMGMADGPDGEAEGSYYFKGIQGSRVEVPNNGALCPRSYMTMQCWLFPEGETDVPLFSYQRDLKGNLYDYGVSFWLHNTSTKLSAQFSDQDKGKSQKEVRADVIKNDEWQFISATYSLTTGYVKLYRNGEEVESHEAGDVNLATQYPVIMGGKPAAKDGAVDKRCYKGRLAHMQVYNTALTQEQIKEAMERTKKGYY